LRTIPFGINVVDEEGHILFLSENFQNQFGKAAIGKNCWEIYRDNKTQCTDCPLVTGIKTGETAIYEAHGIMGKRIFEISYTGMLFHGNKALLEIFQDITARKQAEDSLHKVHEQLVLAQQSSGTGVWDWDIITGELNWSPELFHLFGLDSSNSETSFDIWNEIIHPDDVLQVEKQIQVAINSHSRLVNEYRIILPTGEIRWITTLGDTFYDAQGLPMRMTGICLDITERKKSEEAVRESEKMYRTLLNTSPEGIIIMDMRGNITEISNITLEIFGAENKLEFLGEHFFHFIPNDEISKLKDVLRRTQLEGLVQNVEFILAKKNQSQFICELSTTLIQEPDGKPKAYMAIIRDISQRKKIEQQLIRTERMVSLGEMASAMAHEINQPLLSISLGIENLFLKIKQANSVDETYFHNKSEKIFEDILRIGRIIDHIRAFSRDHDEYIFTSFNINDSIKNAISMISEQFKHHGIMMTMKLDKKVHPIIGNTYRFEQVILNLLTNAKDALEEKKKTSKSDFEKAIMIRTYQDAKTNYVEVKDNGKGIKPEDIDRIMFPFYTTKEVGKGTGLGLSISFGIIKELNGNIEIESDNLKGTIFRISLPVPVEKQ
jgi:PAS domain S-box-containing protein